MFVTLRYAKVSRPDIFPILFTPPAPFLRPIFTNTHHLVLLTFVHTVYLPFLCFYRDLSFFLRDYQLFPNST